MQKPWTDKDRRRGTRTIRWYTGNKIEKTVNGQARVIRERDSFSCGTDKDLYEKKLKEITQSLWSRAAGTANTSKPLADAHKEFVAECKVNGVAWRTIRDYDTNVPWFFKVPGILTTGDCTEENVRAYKLLLLAEEPNCAKKKTGALAPNYVHRRLRDLAAFFNWCVENKYLETHPIVAINRGRRHGKREGFIPKGKPRPRFYSDNEIIAIERLMADYPYYCDPGTGRGNEERANVKAFHAMIRLGYMAGMREGEIATARGEDVRRFPEGDGEIKVRSLKGGIEKVRSVPLCREAVELLPDIKHGFLFPGWVIEHEEYGFISKQRKIAVHWEGVRANAKIEAAAGQPAPTFYGLRHTFARLYLERTPNLKALAEIMGHENTEMVSRVYGFMAQGHLRDSVNKIHWPGSAGQRLGKLDIIEPKLAQNGPE